MDGEGKRDFGKITLDFLVVWLFDGFGFGLVPDLTVDLLLSFEERNGMEFFRVREESLTILSVRALNSSSFVCFFVTIVDIGNLL